MIEFRYIKKPHHQVFVLCLLLAVALFLPIVIFDGLNGDIFHYAGDYNSQQIHFWTYENSFLKQGGSFSWNTELGSGFLNSYSFYGIASPFFWLSFFVPSKFMPWAMVPLLCLKFAIAGLGGYIWSKRWVKNTKYAMLVGVLYAFCGYNIYSVFYNNFLDTTSLFPFLLASLDDTVIDGKKASFPLWVAINLVTNYFFFFGEAVFLVIYYICMTLGKAYRVRFATFCGLAFESILGVCIGCILLIPAAISLMQVPRVGSYLNDYGIINYSSGQKYMSILSSLFLMPDAPYSDNLFPSAGTRWQNCTAFLPIVGIAGGLALNRSSRLHPFSRIMRFSLICAFIPVLNALFTMENANYYARWYYMPILILCGSTGVVFENEPIASKECNGAFKTAIGFTLIFILLGLAPSTVELFGTRLGLAKSARQFWPIWIMSIVSILIGAVIFKRYYKTERFISLITCAVFIFSFLYGETHLIITRFTSDNTAGEHNWYAGYEDTKNVKALLPSGEFYRTDTGGEDNYNFDWDTSSESFFSSTVSPGIFSFYQKMGLDRGVHSTFSQELYGLRSLLSTRFVIVRPQYEDSWSAIAEGGEIEIASDTVSNIGNVIGEAENEITYIPAEWSNNWKEYGRTNEFVIYENQNFIPIGFTYDYYITETQYENIKPEDCPNLLLKALVLSDEQIEKYGSILKPLPESEISNLSYETYARDCSTRRDNTVSSFEANNYGFVATTNFAEDELVFFSVPYEKNAFTATVNGASADVEEVDGGLIAIPVSAGDAEIVVTYHTPGLKIGTTISIAGIIVWVIYAIVCYRRRKDKASAGELQV